MLYRIGSNKIDIRNMSAESIENRAWLLVQFAIIPVYWDKMQKTTPPKTLDIMKYHKFTQTTDM